MAITIICPKCDEIFITSSSNYLGLCKDCDGTNDRIREEEERWNALNTDDKLNELRQEIIELKNMAHWDGRIG